MDRLGSLQQIQELLARQESAHELAKCISAFTLPCDVTQEEWLAATKLVGDVAAQGRPWFHDEERPSLHYQCTGFIRRAFVESWPGGYGWEKRVEDSLLPFIQWLESQPDSEVVDFAWELLFRIWHDNESPRNYDPVLWMKHSGRLSGEISFDNLELAVTLAEEGDAMFWWPSERWRVVNWSRESQQYMEFMNHSSYLVRAAAACCLGHLFYGCWTKPAVGEILEVIKQQERLHAGIAGPFLQGAQFAFERLGDKNYDYRTWFLDVLRNSEREREAPHFITLEFYAHEFFSGDNEAIEEFLKMGRNRLAFMTATGPSESIYDRLPLLQKMTHSEDPKLARAATKYLAEGTTHAGSEFFDD